MICVIVALALVALAALAYAGRRFYQRAIAENWRIVYDPPHGRRIFGPWITQRAAARICGGSTTAAGIQHWLDQTTAEPTIACGVVRESQRQGKRLPLHPRTTSTAAATAARRHL
jgi:hypothetical protein